MAPQLEALPVEAELRLVKEAGLDLALMEQSRAVLRIEAVKYLLAAGRAAVATTTVIVGLLHSIHQMILKFP